MAFLILIRHALPNIDPETPSEDWSLSAAGREAAARLAVPIANYRPKLVLSGPEAKVIGTAEIIAEQLGIGTQLVPALAEHRRRSAPYVSTAEFESAVCRLFDNPSEVVFGEESADVAYQRFATAIDRELAARGEDTVFVVSGGTVISLFVSRRARISPLPLWRRLGMPTVLALDRTSWEIVAVHQTGATVDRGDATA